MWMHPEKYLVYSEVRNLTYTTHSPEETEKLGEAIAQRLSGGEVLALFGGMGMGKTALTRGLARGLGVEAGVSSPTFALVHEYHGRLPSITLTCSVWTAGTISIPPAFLTIWNAAACW